MINKKLENWKQFNIFRRTDRAFNGYILWMNMNNKNLFQTILLTILILIPVDSLAQRIENVHPDIAGEKIHIYYDLLGIAADQSVIVKVFMSTDGGKTYGEPLKSVAGDVGVLVGPGENRCIIWDVFEDVDELVSVNVKFKVRADLLQSEQYGQLPERKFKLDLNANLGSKGILDSKSFGFNLKGAIYLKQLGLGLRADYYKTFREEINYSDSNNNYPDTGFYWGYAGGAIIEFDLIRNTKYSLYPFLYVGQTKIMYKYNPEYKKDEYFKYTIFGSLGLGLDINIVKFLYLGVELEYYLSPWFDVVPSEDPDEGLDGFCIGFVVKFVLNPG
ncbi:MAG TPA: hypothetical protein VMW76_01700 [Bacteroidales bacterium]|nr:hypothetical protein [Bacteroidales bacterium]